MDVGFNKNKPDLEKFNLTKELYAEIKTSIENFKNKKLIRERIFGYFTLIIAIIISLFIILLIWNIFIYNEFGQLLLFCSFIIFFILSGLIRFAFDYMVGFFEKCYEKHKLNNIKGYKDYLEYENELSDNLVKQRIYEEKQNEIRRKEKIEADKIQKEIKKRKYEFWISLDPYQFESEIGQLFSKRGYRVSVTKGSGDEGIDIKLERLGEKSIVQCKRLKKKVGPAPVRDLFGTMMAGNYKYAFLVCPSGFSEKAYEFAKNKNIQLIGLDEIINMVNLT